MGDNIDSELLIIINKLTSIQKEVGGAKKSAVLGEDGKIDRFLHHHHYYSRQLTTLYLYLTYTMYRFLDLRQTMTERIASVKESMESIKQLEKANANPKEIIIAQSKIRSELTKLNEVAFISIIFRYFCGFCRCSRCGHLPPTLTLPHLMCARHLLYPAQDYTELQNSYNSEAKKKRSKFTSDDLALRQQVP